MLPNELFDDAMQNGVTPNGLYILFCLHSNRYPVNVNITTEIRRLEHAGYVSQFKLTEAGTKLVNKYLSPTPEKKRTKAVTFNETDLEKIQEFRDLFPKGTLPSGQPSRVPLKELEKKFKWFFQLYDYDWDTILQATRKYVAKYEIENYQYMKTSGYFISKLDKGTMTSTLASYCDMILEGGDSVQEDTYSSHDVI